MEPLQKKLISTYHKNNIKCTLVIFTLEDMKQIVWTDKSSDGLVD